MFDFFNIARNITIGAASLLALVGGVFVQTSVTVVIPPPQIAVVRVESSTLPATPTANATSPTTTAAIVAAVSASKTSNSSSSVELILSPIKPGLLPAVKQLSFMAATAAPLSAKSVNAKTESSPAVPAASKTASAPDVITPQWMLDHTAASLSQNLDSSYHLSLATAIGLKNLEWGFEVGEVGGKDGAPEFAVTYSCNPLPLPPKSPADTAIRFDMRTSYECQITLTDKTGHVAQKNFPFQTGSGRLVISKATGMDIVLRDNEDDNGFVLNNQDSEPLAITALTFDASFTALVTSSPLVIRFADPKSGYTLAEYPLNNLPPVPYSPNIYGVTGASVGLNFNVPARTQKLILAKAIGVHKTTFLGINPDVKITLKNIRTASDAKQFFQVAAIDWTCQIDNEPYNQSAQKPSNVCTQ